MTFKFLIIPSVLIFQVAGAQSSPASLTLSQGTTTTPISAASSTPVSPPVPPSVSTPLTDSPEATRTRIVDYKSVYEAATVEEEVKTAAERFNLSTSQQDVWLIAATDRREAERQAREKLDSKADNLQKDAAYRGLRSSLNTFHETITGHLSPAQKQALESDRLIMEEKRQRLAKLPPPPPPAPTVTVAPVDSAAIKEVEKSKATTKKSKKKKKPVSQ